MALINTIRQKSWIAIAFVGISMVAFIAGDKMLTQCSGGPDLSDNNVGEINGRAVPQYEMQDEINMLSQQYFDRTGLEVKEDQVKQLQDEAWNRLLYKHAYKPAMGDLGLSISKEEKDDMIAGNNIHSSIMQSFVNPTTQQFDKNQLLSYITAVESDEKPQGQNISDQEFESRKNMWIGFKKQLEDMRLQEKFTGLIGKSTYVTSAEAKRNHVATSSQANIKYAYVPYYAIADSLVEVNDNMLSDYLAKNLKRYEKPATRTIDYVVFDVLPSAQDTLAAKEEMEELKGEFQESDKDTMFIDQYSDESEIPTKRRADELPLALKSLASVEKGYVTDPILEGGNYVVYKVVDSFEDTIYSVKASHILIKWDTESDEDKASAKSKARSILDSIKRGEDFGEMAKVHSTDKSNAGNGGDLGWFSEGRMVPAFNEAVFAKNGTGLVNDIIETRFGYHLINVTEPKNNNSFVIGKIQRAIFAGEDTKDDAYRKVGDFLADASTRDAFIAKADSSNAAKKFTSQPLTAMDSRLVGLKDGRTVVQWAFRNGMENEISNIMSLEDAYVVATVTGSSEENMPNLDMVRQEVTSKVTNIEKAKYIKEKLDANADFGSIVSQFGANAKTGTTNALKLNSSSIKDAGLAPEGVGALFGLGNGERSGTIETDNGILVVEMIALTEAAEKEDYTIEKSSVLSAVEGRSTGVAFQTLNDLMDIEDTRYKHY